MRWAVEIQQTNLTRRNLTDLLANLGLKVVDIADRLALISEEMDSCSSADAVFDVAKRVRTAMKGSAGIDPEFELGAILDFCCDPPKRHVFLEGLSSMHSVSSLSGSLTLGPPKDMTVLELKAWEEKQAENEYQAKLEGQWARLEPAYRSEDAEKMLSLLSQKEPAGATLYKVYELAEGHPDNRSSFQAEFDISQEEFRRFQDVIHNPAVSGDWARHAYPDKLKSDRPMSRDEAEQFVRKIASRWLDGTRKSGRAST